MKPLSLDILRKEASDFAYEQSGQTHAALFGRANSKVVGTYFEKLLNERLSRKYEFISGNSASGIDYPDLNVDVKVTSIRQPQSSCPYRSARQKVYGLGYDLLVFVYKRTEIVAKETTKIEFSDTIYVEGHRTADWQTTLGIRNILDNNGNADDLIGFFYNRNFPIEEIGATALAEEIMENPPELGYLTISNALQWRLQYMRVIAEAGKVRGVLKL